jgi:hypothetical protein
MEGAEVFLDVDDLIRGVETNHVDRGSDANGMEHTEGVDPQAAARTQMCAKGETAPAVDQPVGYVSA